MNTRLVLALVAIWALAGCQKAFTPPAVRAVARRAGEELGDRFSLARVREHVDASYRVPPDRRFLLALQELDSVAGTPVAPVEATWDGSGWAVRRGNELLGRVPRWPRWEDLWAVLVRRAQQQSKKLAALFEGTPPAAGVPGEPFARARALAELWKKAPSRKLLADATSLAVAMAVASEDAMETGDRVEAHALALVALGEALGIPRPGLQERMAVELGYWPESLNRPGDELVRAFLREDENAVCGIADREPENLEAKAWCTQILLARLDFGGAAARAERWDASDPFALAYLGSLLKELQFPSSRSVGLRAMETAVALARGRKAPRRDWVPGGEGQLRRFEKALARLSWPSENGIFPRPWAQDFLRATFASGVHAVVEYVQGMGGVEAPRELERVVGPPETLWGFQIRLFVEARLPWPSPKEAERALKNAVFYGESVGARPRVELYWEFLNRLPYASVESLAWARVVFSRMDTRPSHRELLWDLGREGLLHLALAEEAADALWESSRWLFLGARARVLGVKRQGHALLELYQNPDLTPKQRATVFFTLIRDRSLPLSEVEGICAHAGEVTPAFWNAAEECASAYVVRGRLDKAVAELEGAARRLHPDSLEYAVCRARQAALELLAKNPKKALETVEEVVPSYQGDVLHTYVRALLANGELDEALEWAQRARERYPQSRGLLAALVEVHWARKEWDAAALVLRRSPTFTVSHWDAFLAPRFVRAFAEDPTGATAVVASLAGVFPGEFLMTLATEAIRQKQFSLALLVASETHERAPREDIACLVFSLAEKTWGKERATRWLWEHTRVEPPARLAVECWRADAFGVPWEAFPLEFSGEAAERLWLQRAAAVARGWKLRREQENALHRYIQQGREKFWHRLVAITAGMASPDDFREVTSCELEARWAGDLAYYLGLAAEARGDVREALGWYRVTLETSPWVSYQFRWAFDRLVIWRSCHRAVDQLVGCRAERPTWGSWWD
ncbi:MAG: tetratricopeptide repeat protein [Thermoanaerobaculum sp.]